MPLILVATLSVAGVMERPQIAQSQTDFEECIIMESVDQRINQQNIGRGSSTNFNCGTNTAGTHLAHIDNLSLCLRRNASARNLMLIKKAIYLCFQIGVCSDFRIL